MICDVGPRSKPEHLASWRVTPQDADFGHHCGAGGDRRHTGSFR